MTAVSASSPSHSHILPLRMYLVIWGALMVFTAITVGVSRIDFGAGNTFVAILVATIKASLVALYFMHLRYDNKFNLVILVTSFLFVALFLVPTLTDLTTRGDLDPEHSKVERTKPLYKEFKLRTNSWTPLSNLRHPLEFAKPTTSP